MNKLFVVEYTSPDPTGGWNWSKWSGARGVLTFQDIEHARECARERWLEDPSVRWRVVSYDRGMVFE
jgi:hypothetical protein